MPGHQLVRAHVTLRVMSKASSRPHFRPRWERLACPTKRTARSFKGRGNCAARGFKWRLTSSRSARVLFVLMTSRRLAATTGRELLLDSTACANFVFLPSTPRSSACAIGDNGSSNFSTVSFSILSSRARNFPLDCVVVIALLLLVLLGLRSRRGFTSREMYASNSAPVIRACRRHASGC